MHPQDSRKMSGRRKGLRTWKWHFLLMLWILMLANPQRNVHAYFLGDIKAVLNGCEDHWTLQDEAAFPRLYRMTVCVNVRVVAPGPWIAFTYSSVHGLMPELGLEGDEGALYVWLLRVRHRFPIQLSLQDWHQVCLRRDVVGHALSLEVDGRTVGHRVVIAQAIPSSGSLWLGCGQRDQPEGVAPGQVELYLFRLWADLQQHQPCEDGSVIGWKSDYWGVTSANARQRDDNLPCVHRKPRRRYRRAKSSDLTCPVKQLCSNNNIYFWMPVLLKKNAGFETEKDVHDFMSSVFSCANHPSIFDRFCRGDNPLKVENVSCIIEEGNKNRKGRCGVVLQLNSTVSASELRQAGRSAQQQPRGNSIEVIFTGKVERVGRCDGGFVTCPSFPLEDICPESNKQSNLTCKIMKPDHVLDDHANPTSCPEEETHNSSCTAFCNRQNHFYAQQLNVTDVNTNTVFLENMLTDQVVQTCRSNSSQQCVNVLQNQGFKKTYVNCQNIHKRSYSCIMILEMTKPITDCSVITVLQTLINKTENVTTEGPLTHTVFCGNPKKSINSTLSSHLTWFLLDMHTADVCEKDQPHLKCVDNENITVLLSDTCPSQLTSAPPPIKTTEIPSTTTTMTQAKTTIPSTHSTSPPTTPPTTVTTTAEPATITHTSSSTLHPTVAKITDTHNTEVTTRLPEPTLRTTTLSDTTLKRASIQTVSPTTATVLTRETATSSIATQGLTITTDATTSNTLASTINEASEPTSANPTTATTTDQATTLPSTSDDTITSKALPTTSTSPPLTTKPDTTVPTTNSNTITTTTASTAEVSYDTDEPNTASSSTTSRITTEEATAASTDIDNSTAKNLFDSTTSDNVDTRNGDEMSMTTVAQTTDVSKPKRTTLLSTILTTTAATINSNTTANITSSKTINATTVASEVVDTTEASSTTSFSLVSTSDDTKKTLPILASNLVPTTMTDTTTTNGTTQTTPNPLTSAVTGSIPSTKSSDTVATTIATQITSTQMPDTSGTSSQSTTTGDAASQSVSEPITAETTQVTTTSTSYSTSTQQQTTINTSEGTSPSESPANPTTAELQSVINNVTSPTTLLPTSNGGLEPGRTSMETVTMTIAPSQNPTTTVTAISGFTASTTDAQSSTARTTMLPSSVTEHNVTTSSNAATVGTPNTSKIQNNTAVTSDVTRITSTAVSEMHNTTTIGHKMTTNAVTTPYTPKYNVTMLDATMVTTATTAATTTTTAFTPTTEQATVTTETKPDTSTSMASLNTTTSSKDTTLSSINTSTIAQDTTIKVSDKKPETTTSNAFESTTASTQASETTSNTAAYFKSTHSSTTTITPTNIQTTESTLKTSTAEVTSPGSVLSSQSPTPAVTPVSTTTITSTSLSPQPTYNRTTITAEASRTTLQTTTTWDTSKSDPGQTTRSEQDLEEEANNLLSQTEDISRLNSSQVSKLVGQLESLLDGPTVSQALGKMAINIISNLMEGDAQVLSASANRLVRLVDRLGLKLEVSGGNEVLSATSLVLAVQTVDWSESPTITAYIFGTDDVQFNDRRPESSGPPLGSMVLPSSLTEGLSPEELRQSNTVQFTFYTKNTLFQDPTLNNEMLVSPVLGCSVANLSITNLTENIQFTIRNVKPIKTNYSVTCVFWDFKVNGGAGGWNNSGCHVVDFTPEDTTCSCSHLTSFAVLLDFSREGILDQKQAQVLTFITYIGCGVSAVFLSITILTYLSFEKLLRDIPAKILVHLCISLLGLNLVFLLDGWLALHKVDGLCISTAFFLHYFLLTSFTWAGLEALHMYLSIVRVFTPYLSKYMMKFTIMGWGIPLIVPVIIIAVDKDNYGLVSYGNYSDGTTDDFCWLRDDTAFYVGVVAYFLLMFTLCLIIFIAVLVQLARIKRENPQNQSPNRSVLTDLRSISGLIILLGLTWGFALFAWGPLYLPFVYLFCIFNSLQGFFIFVFHCAVKENVRRQWRTYLCCGRLRLPENSEWSRTATHNNKNTSFTIMSSSAAHLASSSSSVVSETNSSGSAYADSGISDGSTSDVVLNEIHRRNMARHL